MVEYTYSLDNIFSSLADPTRRDILRRVTAGQLSVGDLARAYDLSFAAVSKHLKVLEAAQLINKHRKGKQQLVSLSPAALATATEYLQWYSQFANARFDSLDNYINKENK